MYMCVYIHTQAMRDCCQVQGAYVIHARDNIVIFTIITITVITITIINITNIYYYYYY